jgi:protoporphyrinogen/coproporphyrinogen III oxidase
LIRISKNSNSISSRSSPKRFKNSRIVMPPAPATHFPAIVIGAGVSGLTCAYTLRQRGVDAHLFESSDRAGGVIRSQRRDDFLFELGPQSFSFTESLQKLARDLQLSAEIRPAPEKLPRYLLIDGQLAAAPLSPPAFLASPLFSAGTKFSVLRDLLGKTKPPAETSAGDESIAHFVRRKFSNELLEKLVGPFISGIYAGDPEKLSLRSAFPTLYAAESAHGSVIRGMLRAKRSTRGSSPALATFQHGNQALTNALASSLGSALHLETEAARILLSPSWAPGRFIVEFRAPNAVTPPPNPLYADHVILAAPADVAAKLLEALDPSLSPLLASIVYSPVCVVSLGYRRSAITNPLHGFGFLVPRSSSVRTLGCVWNSSLFPDRAPEGAVLLTSFVGGAFDPAAANLSPQDLQTIVHQELRRILDINEAPIISNTQIWPHAIPQYDLGHHRRAQLLTQKLAAFPGLALAGNYRDGPAAGAVIDRARNLADDVVDRP